MLPERNDVLSEEDEEEEDEDEFQMLERLTREIDGLAAPTMTSSREYSSPLRESIKAFVGKRSHHIPRGNSLNSGGSGGFPSKKNTNSNNNENGLRSKSEKSLTTTTRDEMMRRKRSTRNQQEEANTQALLSKYRALKRAFRKLSEDYDYNFALFKERDEELDLLEEQLKIEKMKTNRYRERVRELEREVALRETAS